MNVVVGLGKTGLSCVRYCLRKGWPVAVTDSRKSPPGLSELPESVPSAFGVFSEEMILSADRLILSPGVSLQEPLVVEAIARGVECVGDIDLFAREVQAPIIAITGSNAKSTVTDLVGKMAQASGISTCVAGNIGTPVLDVLCEPAAELYVLELSSFQLETMHALHPAVAVVLNVSEDHMDRYPDFEAYRRAKMRIYDHCDIAVINLDDPTIWPSHVSKQIGFSRRQKLPVRLSLSGAHNAQNALAALAIGQAAGLDRPAMLTTLEQYRGLPHRCQFVRRWKKVDWYNDSKGTNVGATIAAIEGLAKGGKRIVLIAGGDGKGADFSPLQNVVAQHVHSAVLLGQDKALLANILQPVCDVHVVDTLQAAVSVASDVAKPGDTVLLSPACSSLDMFQNYEERGHLFEQYVRKMS